jgi:hypothetical protein
MSVRWISLMIPTDTSRLHREAVWDDACHASLCDTCAKTAPLAVLAAMIPGESLQVNGATLISVSR